MPKQKMPKKKSTKNTGDTSKPKDKSINPINLLENNCDDGIAKSKQLQSKLLGRKRPAGRVAKKKTVIKICSNGMIKSALENLEKMFEDSDDEQDSSANQDSIAEVRSHIRESPPANRAKESINFSKTIFNAKSAERLKHSDTGYDNDTTITYDISSNQQHRFSPEPSTSGDIKTFLKNDKLLNQTLERSNIESVNDSETHKNSKVSSNLEDDIVIIEEPFEIIEIDHEDNYSALRRLSVKKNTEEIIPSSPIVIEDDPNYESIPKKCKEAFRTSSPINVDDIYSSVGTINVFTVDADCEVINIDDVLAENNTILKKYSRGQNLNTVTHVVLDICNSDNITKTNVNINSTVINEENKITEGQIGTQTSSRTSKNEEPLNTLREKTLELLHFIANAQPVNGPLQQSRSSNTRQDLRMPNSNRVTSRDYRSYHRNAILPSINNAGQTPSPQNLPARMGQVTVNNYESPTGATPVRPYNYQSPTRGTRVTVDNYRLPAQTETVTGPPIQANQASSPSPEARKGMGDCPICMDSLAGKALVATICGHVFCKTCIEAALKSTGRKCPTCRKVLKKNSYHQLYL